MTRLAVAAYACGMDHPETSPPMHGTWLEQDPIALMRRHLGTAGHAWSVGTWGAIGEFAFDAGEAGLSIDLERLTVRSARGGLRIEPHVPARALAISSAEAPARVREIAFCLPLAAAGRAARETVAELGADSEAIAPADRSALLFDVGVGAAHVDMLVRVAPRAASLLSALRADLGCSFFSGHAAAAVLADSPPRIFVSALARLEVDAPIPPPGGRSPEGPHSHLLPHLLRQRRPHGPSSPIPEGWACGLSLYPRSSVAD